MNEPMSDQLLNIETMGDQRGFYDSLHYHPYEATPYVALERLFYFYPLSSSDRLVDFGCGKGRLSFMANYRFDATVIGIEMDEGFYQEAVHNRTKYVRKFNKDEKKLLFYHTLAQEYEVHRLDNVFFFFNPFSIQIFIAVLQNILKSFEESERDITLILYYGSPEYFYYLEDYSPFELVDEIKLNEYEKNPFERFLIYHLPAS